MESVPLQPAGYETWWQWGLIVALALLTLVVLVLFRRLMR
jgi:uncharacterized protein YpmS